MMIDDGVISYPIRVAEHMSRPVELLGRWSAFNLGNKVATVNGNGVLSLPASGEAMNNPVILKTVRLKKFQVDFRYINSDDADGIFRFDFDITNTASFKTLRGHHRIVPAAPANNICIDGDAERSVAASFKDNSAIPPRTGPDLWFRVTCDGTTVEVQCALTQAGLATAPVASRCSYEGRLSGGHLGFRYGGTQCVDDVTVRTDQDGDGSYPDPVDQALILSMDGDQVFAFPEVLRDVDGVTIMFPRIPRRGA
jgi:hypothetical protein